MYLAAIDLTVLATKTAQFILSFSIIVVLHELGHLILDLVCGKRR
jgi:membrane-associated protease RseP (regulator of RpoE activity)